MAILEGVDVGLLFALFLKTCLAIGIDAPLGNDVGSTTGLGNKDGLDSARQQVEFSRDWKLTGAEGTPAEPGSKDELVGRCLRLLVDLPGAHQKDLTCPMFGVSSIYPAQDKQLASGHSPYSSCVL